MRYRVVPGSTAGEYLVVTGSKKVVIGTFDDKKDATELIAYLNGGDKVPSYMTEKESKDG
jgi:hypothetical protein